MNWKSITRADRQNMMPGYSNEIWLAKKSDFLVLQEPVVSPTPLPGETLTISVAHTFPAGKGFIRVACQPYSTEVNGQLVGPEGAKRWIWNPQFVVPGDSPELLEWLIDAANEEIIGLYKDATCPGGQLVQFGCDCTPMTVSEGAFASSNAGADDGQKAYTITGKSPCKYFYDATVTEATA